MRHLVDLDNKVAIITWREKYVFPHTEENRYHELASKKYRFYEKLSDEEEIEFEHLKKLKGKVQVDVQKIEFSNLLTVSMKKISTVFLITGADFNKINKEIDILNEQFTDRTVVIDELETYDY